MRSLKMSRLIAIATIAASTFPVFAVDAKIGSADTKDFICKVAPNIGVADSFWSQAKSMSHIRGGDGCPDNWWLQTSFTGGKYKALACDSIQVVASSADVAGRELFSMYLKNAPQQPAQRYGMSGTNARHFTQSELVQGCVPDPTSTRGVAIKAADPTSARLVMADVDHLSVFFKMYPEKVDDERLARLFNTQFKAPADAFERREAIAKAASEARNAISRTPSGAYRIETAINVSPYSFDKGKFELPYLDRDVQRMNYSRNPLASSELPTYALTLPASLKEGYTPRDTQEARKIEHERVAAGHSLKAVVFLQPAKAWMKQEQPVINAVVSRIDVTDGKGKILFSLAAR